MRGQWELEAIELDLLSEGIRRHYGLDLAAYARPLLLRRLRQVAAQRGYESLSLLQAAVLHSAAEMDALLATLTSEPGELFDDPAFFGAFRRVVVPWLKTHPSIRVWHAGCGTPEDIYSLAILLHEEGLLARSRIYATDGCLELLARAQAGQQLTPDARAQARYAASGGLHSLASYFMEAGGIAPLLKERIFFTQHHLTNDGPFNEFHAVMCRNTMLHYSRSQQTHIHGLLFESLARFGFLGIGRKESLRRTPYVRAYDEIGGAGRLFRRVS